MIELSIVNFSFSAGVIMTVKELMRRRLEKLLEAEEQILINQSYKIGDREYVRADLDKVRKAIDDLIAAGVTLEDESPPVMRRAGVPVDN